MGTGRSSARGARHPRAAVLPGPPEPARLAIVGVAHGSPHDLRLVWYGFAGWRSSWSWWNQSSANGVELCFPNQASNTFGTGSSASVAWTDRGLPSRTSWIAVL